MRGGIDEAHTETEMKNCGSISQCGEAQYCKVYDTTSQLWNLWYNCQLFLIPMQGIFFQLPQAPEIGLGLSTKELGRSPLCSCATCYGCFPHCFCWPHTDYKPTTYWPHTNHIPTTYWPHTNHIQYQPHTKSNFRTRQATSTNLLCLAVALLEFPPRRGSVSSVDVRRWFM